MAIVAQVIEDAPPNTLDYLLYPEQSAVNQQYILNQLNNYQHLWQDVQNQYAEKAQQLYQAVNNSQVARAARAAIRSVKGALRPNVLCELIDLEDVRSAGSVMQRYIMAQPTIRKLYHEQRCDGYSDSYIDKSPGIIGFGHNEYMSVMSGIIQETTDVDGEDSWKVSTYAFDMLESEKELTFDNKVDILHTWEIIEIAIKAGEDPTDKFEGRL